MTESITASKIGQGGPYLIVSKKYVESLLKKINSAKFTESGDKVLNVDKTPKEIATDIESWFEEQGIKVEKLTEGDEKDPGTIHWDFSDSKC